MLRILAVLLAGCAFLSGCGNSKLAELAVNSFHSQLNSEEYRAIYESADARLRSTKSESNYVKLLQDVHQRLENVKGCTPTLENAASNPPTVTLHYETTFERGTANEQFVWLIKDNQAILDRYGIAYIYATNIPGKSRR